MIEIDTETDCFSFGRDVYVKESINPRVSMIDLSWNSRTMTGWFVYSSGIGMEVCFEI